MHLTVTLSMLGNNFSRQHFEIFLLFFPRKQDLIRLFCMTYQILFSGKNKKNTINLSSGFSLSVLSVDEAKRSHYSVMGKFSR